MLKICYKLSVFRSVMVNNCWKGALKDYLRYLKGNKGLKRAKRVKLTKEKGQDNGEEV